MCGRYTHNLTWGDIVRLYRLTQPEAAPELSRRRYGLWSAVETSLNSTRPLRQLSD
jgi:hypothetical protein